MNPADIAAWVVTVIHATFALTEMFLWQLPKVHTRLGFTAATAAVAAPVVRNAGVYNAFLAVALGAIILLPAYPQEIRTYLLGCAIVAGIVGAATLKWTVFVIQSVPAVIALTLWLARSN